MLDQMGTPISVSLLKDTSLSFGTLNLLVRRRPGEWHFVSHRSSELNLPYSMEERDSAENEVWERWITGDDGNEIVLRPAFPSLSSSILPIASYHLHTRTSQFISTILTRIYIIISLADQPIL